MKKIIENIEHLKKYIVVIGDNYNADRCINMDIKTNNNNYNITICCNSETNSVAICEVIDDNNNEVSDKVFDDVLEQLLINAENYIYSEQDEENYDFYISTIEPCSNCCEHNCSTCRKY